MEEMATWDMIFNKTNYGKTGNECPSRNEIASIANHMTLNCSVQNDFSNSYNFAFNITGNKI